MTELMIELEKDIDPFRSLALQDFSYSRLSTYSDCELKYFFTYILQEPRSFGAPASLGNIIHQSLEYGLEDGERPNLFGLLDVFDASRPEFDPDNLISEELLESGREMIREFVDRHRDDVFEIVAQEMAFSVVLGPARLNGFIDLIHKDRQGNIKCIDWKSGRHEVAGKDIENDLQLGLYALVLSFLYPEQESFYAELYYLKSGRRKGHLFTRDDLLLVQSKLVEGIKEVLSKENFVATENTSKCFWCDHAKSGVCHTGKYRLSRKNKNFYFSDYD